MATREKFLALTWKEVINAPMSGAWIDNIVASSQSQPDAPFADLGPALKRLLKCGADRRDLSLIARMPLTRPSFRFFTCWMTQELTTTITR